MTCAPSKDRSACNLVYICAVWSVVAKDKRFYNGTAHVDSLRYSNELIDGNMSATIHPNILSWPMHIKICLNSITWENISCIPDNVFRDFHQCWQILSSIPLSDPCCQYIGYIGGHITLSLRRWELTSLRRQLSTYGNVTHCWQLLCKNLMLDSWKRIHYGCLVRIEKSAPRDHCLAFLGKA